MSMRSSLSTFLTAVIAVAGAAVIALVLAEHTAPEPAQLLSQPGKALPQVPAKPSRA